MSEWELEWVGSARFDARRGEGGGTSYSVWGGCISGAEGHRAGWSPAGGSSSSVCAACPAGSYSGSPGAFRGGAVRAQGTGRGGGEPQSEREGRQLTRFEQIGILACLSSSRDHASPRHATTPLLSRDQASLSLSSGHTLPCHVATPFSTRYHASRRHMTMPLSSSRYHASSPHATTPPFDHAFLSQFIRIQ